MHARLVLVLLSGPQKVPRWLVKENKAALTRLPEKNKNKKENSYDINCELNDTRLVSQTNEFRLLMQKIPHA